MPDVVLDLRREGSCDLVRASLDAPFAERLAESSDRVVERDECPHRIDRHRIQMSGVCQIALTGRHRDGAHGRSLRALGRSWGLRGL